MLSVPDYEFWFVTGSQHLYGEEQLKSVAKDAQDIADKLNASGKLPYKVVFKDVMTTAESITNFTKKLLVSSPGCIRSHQLKIGFAERNCYKSHYCT